MNKLLIITPLVLGVIAASIRASVSPEVRAIQAPDEEKPEAKQSEGSLVAFQVTGMKKTNSGAT